MFFFRYVMFLLGNKFYIIFISLWIFGIYIIFTTFHSTSNNEKIFEDRMDLESVALILPEFKKQQDLINRRTIVQQTTQRTSTIYTENNGGAYGGGWFGGGGQF